MLLRSQGTIFYKYHGTEGLIFDHRVPSMGRIIYKEIQDKKPPIVYFACTLLFLAATLIPLLGLVLETGSMTDHLPIWAIIPISAVIGLGMPALILYSRMVILVDDDGVLIEYRPFIKRRIYASEIESVSMVDDVGLSDGGGWGIRFQLLSLRNRKYSMSGHQGVLLETIYSSRILLGTDSGEELLRALEDVIIPFAADVP